MANKVKMTKGTAMAQIAAFASALPLLVIAILASITAIAVTAVRTNKVRRDSRSPMAVLMIHRRIGDVEVSPVDSPSDKPFARINASIGAVF